MRLDFDTFVITGPYTTTTTVISTLNGVINKKSGSKDVSLVSACLTDVFSVSDQVCLYLPRMKFDSLNFCPLSILI